MTSWLFALSTEDVDGDFERAIAAGAEALTKPRDYFWGERTATLTVTVGASPNRWKMSARKKWYAAPKKRSAVEPLLTGHTQRFAARSGRRKVWQGFGAFLHLGHAFEQFADGIPTAFNQGCASGIPKFKRQFERASA